MKRVIRSLLVIAIFSSIFTACSKQNQASVPVNEVTLINKVYFIEPDKIVIYKNGNTQNITKESKLFSDIVNQMNDRVDKSINVFRLGFDENNMRTIKQKEIVVEFVYSKNQMSKFEKIEKQYNSLIFPLTGEKKEFCFFDNGKDDYSGPIGNLNNPEVLLDLLK